MPSGCSSRRRRRSATGCATVDISGDDELERRHRHEIPLVTIAGRRAFKYQVDPAELRRRVIAADVTIHRLKSVTNGKRSLLPKPSLH